MKVKNSNFVDYVKILCRSGKGGPGSSHFLRAARIRKCAWKKGGGLTVFPRAKKRQREKLPARNLTMNSTHKNKSANLG